MTAAAHYATVEPPRSAIDACDGAVLVEFGSPHCGYCRAAEPLVAAALDAHPRVAHFRIADGRGRPLGRSFGVKLWPTLVFTTNGKEIERLVRPTDAAAIRAALARIDPPAAPPDAHGRTPENPR